MAKRVREPIQVYLSPEEREALDRIARQMGVSRSEALRRGIEAVERLREGGPLPALAERGLVTPASAPPGEPPTPGDPVAPLDELLRELGADRDDR